MFPKNRRSESMSTFQAADLIRRVADPRPSGDSVKAAIGRAARRLGWSWNRAKDVWYADNRISISADEMRALQTQTKEAKQDDEIKARIERLESILLAKDEAFYRPQIDALRAAAGRMGGGD